MTAKNPKSHTGAGRRKKNLIMEKILDPLGGRFRVVFPTRSPPQPPLFVVRTLGVPAVEDQPDSSTGSLNCQDTVRLQYI
jgi:hypothetical protein